MNLDTRDDWGLAGKVAIVTGGGAAGDGVGNGRAAAVLLAKAGARVVVVDRELELAEHTVKVIAGLPGEAIAVEADLTRARDCAAMVEAALDRFGRLDLLDNNVGIGSRGSVLDETEENWRRVMQVNVETMFLAAKHAIPAMRRGGGGAIVNVSSISALRPRGLTLYSTSKGAVIALTRAMAVDHGPDGIRVNCVAPGPVKHADGLPEGHERHGARPATQGLRPRYRGDGLGHRPRRAFPALGPRPLRDGPRPRGGRRRDPARPRARLPLTGPLDAAFLHSWRRHCGWRAPCTGQRAEPRRLPPERRLPGLARDGQSKEEKSVRSSAASNVIRIVLGEHHRLVREGIRCLLEQEKDVEVIGELADGLQVVPAISRLKPGVLVVALDLPGLNGIEVTRQVHQRAPGTKVVVISRHLGEIYVGEALRNGAAAYVATQAKGSDLVRAIRRAMAGRRYLSPPFSERSVGVWLRARRESDPYDSLTNRERQALHLAAEGYSSHAIAGRLSISPRTAETHRANAMRKLAGCGKTA